jgi:hypothetical protein
MNGQAVLLKQFREGTHGEYPLTSCPYFSMQPHQGQVRSRARTILANIDPFVQPVLDMPPGRPLGGFLRIAAAFTWACWSAVSVWQYLSIPDIIATTVQPSAKPSTNTGPYSTATVGQNKIGGRKKYVNTTSKNKKRFNRTLKSVKYKNPSNTKRHNTKRHHKKVTNKLK